MATITEQWEDATYQELPSGERTASRSWVVENLTNGTPVVLTGAEAADLVGVHQGDQYVGTSGQDFGLVVVHIDAKPRKAPWIWTVIARYSTKVGDGRPPSLGQSNAFGDGGADSLGGAGGQDGGGGESPAYPPGGGPSGGGEPTGSAPELIENPLKRPPQISWGSSTIMEVVERDTGTGRPIVNKALLPFDPPIERERYQDVLTVVKNQPRFDALDARRWRGSINSDTFLGDAAYTWRIKDISATRQFEGGIFFWQVTYTLEYREETWNLRVLNQGGFELNAAGNGWVRIREDAGNPMKTKLLDNSGHAITVTGSDFSSQPVFLEFQIYKAQEFRTLRLFAPGG